MDAANAVDWSMGSYAARLADWETARRHRPARRGPGRARSRRRARAAPRGHGRDRPARRGTDPRLHRHGGPGVPLARMGDGALASGSARTSTGCSACSSRSPSAMLDGRPTRAEFKRKALGAQAGALIGLRRSQGPRPVRRVPAPRRRRAAVLRRVRTSSRSERRFSLPPKDFRLWIAIHEVTHRVQFGSATWLRGYLAGQVDEYLGSIQLDSSQLMDQLRARRRGGPVRRRLARHGRRVPAALARAARDVHADAGDDVAAGGPRVVRDERGGARSRATTSTACAARSPRGGSPSSLERTLQRAIGFEQKIRQYDTGERFVRTIVERAGMSTFNLVWRSAGRSADARRDRRAAALAREGRRLANAMRRPPAVARVLERVTATAREHEMFLPGQTVLVAVSGGPDSVCMLESLVRLRRLFRIRLEVFHFDHGLRKDSAADARVRRRAWRIDTACRSICARPRRRRDKGASVEAWAREQRHFAIAEVTHETGAARTAIGHTMDDQAETVLIGLITGQRDPRDERHRARDRHLGEPADRRDARRGGGVLPIAAPAAADAIPRTPIRGSCATPIRLRGIPGPGARGRPEPARAAGPNRGGSA